MKLSLKKSELGMLEKVAGVYKVTNLVTGKIYIGVSFNLKRRFLEHKNRSSNKELRNDIETIGTEGFSFDVLVSFENPNETKLAAAEKYYINLAKETKESIYNVKSGGKVDRLTQEQKNKIAASHIGLKKSDSVKEKCGKINRKAVIHNGVIYESQTAASKVLGISQQVISFNCNGLADTIQIKFYMEEK